MLTAQALAPIVTAGLLVAMHVQLLGETGGADAEAFHASARGAIEQVPDSIGEWQGADVEVPQAAVALLKPNALLGRRYVEASTGRWANLVIVQCRDTRDMSGHYPPVCYPAHGWTPGEGPEERTIRAGATLLPATRYEYTRTEFDRVVRIAIYAFFVVPGEGIVQDMDGIRRAASDYRRRGLGAAQVQVLMDATLPDEEQERIAGEILGAAAPAIVVLDATPESVESTHE